jgi:hypothetical protein
MDVKIILVVCTVFGLAIGGGGAYAFTSGQVATLINEKSTLQETITSLETQLSTAANEKTTLQRQIISLNSEKTSLEGQVSSLTVEKTSFTNQINTLAEEKQKAIDGYDELASTLNATLVKNYTQTITYNITAGTNKVWTFVIPEKGILWDVEIQFSATYVGMIYSWRQGDKRGFVGSSGMSLDCEARPYGPQKFLYGTIKVDYYDDGKGRLWVDAYLTTQFDQVNRGGEAYFDL